MRLQRHWILTLLQLSCFLGVSAAVPPEDGDDGADAVLVSTEFLNACTNGNDNMVLSLLKAHPAWVNGRSADGETCLHVAGIYGQAEVTRLVLEFVPDSDSDASSRANPNIRTTFAKGLRMHPLSWNVYAGHVETVRVLLEHGADPNLDFDANLPSGGSATTRPATVLDVVLHMLPSDDDEEEEDDDDANPRTQQFQQLKELLESFGAKTYQEMRRTAEL